MPRSEHPQPTSGARWRRALAGAVVVPVLALGVACGSSTPDAAGTTSSVAPGTTPGTSSAPAGGSLAVVEDGLDAATTEALNAAASSSFAETSAPGAVVAIRTPEGTWVATAGLPGLGADGADDRRRQPARRERHQDLHGDGAPAAGRGGNVLSLDDPIEKYVPGMPNGTATLARARRDA